MLEVTVTIAVHDHAFHDHEDFCQRLEDLIYEGTPLPKNTVTVVNTRPMEPLSADARQIIHDNGLAAYLDDEPPAQSDILRP